MSNKHRQAQLIIRGFKALDYYNKRQKKAKTIKSKNNFIDGAKFFSEWQVLTKNVLKAKKLRTKVLIEKQF